MIKVYKDKDIAIVTRGLYEAIYKPLGYDIIEEKEKQKEKVDKKNTIKAVK